ncbi:hypothetical protein BH24ACI2_BH24ACI2_05960 [soil metagenome]
MLPKELKIKHLSGQLVFYTTDESVFLEYSL